MSGFEVLGIGVEVDGGLLRAAVACSDGETHLLDPVDTRLDAVDATALSHVARTVRDRCGSDDAPWRLAVSSQCNQASRLAVRDAAARARLRDPQLVATTAAMAAQLKTGSASMLWWGRSGVDVGIVEGSLVGHGGGAALSTDDLLGPLGADELGADATLSDRRAAGQLAAERSRHQGDDGPRWEALVDRWAPVIDDIDDLLGEAGDRVGLSPSPGRLLAVAGTAPVVDAVVETLGDDPAWTLMPVEAGAVASGAARLASGDAAVPTLLGLAIGVESIAADGPQVQVIVPRNATLPARRSLMLGAVAPDLDEHQVLVRACWGPDISMSDEILRLVMAAEPGVDRYRLTIDVDVDGCVAATCTPLG